MARVLGGRRALEPAEDAGLSKSTTGASCSPTHSCGRRSCRRAGLVAAQCASVAGRRAGRPGTRRGGVASRRRGGRPGRGRGGRPRGRGREGSRPRGIRICFGRFERAARLTWTRRSARDGWGTRPKPAGAPGHGTRDGVGREALSTARDTRTRGRLMRLRGRIELQTATAEEARDTFVEGASWWRGRSCRGGRDARARGRRMPPRRDDGRGAGCSRNARAGSFPWTAGRPTGRPSTCWAERFGSRVERRTGRGFWVASSSDAREGRRRCGRPRHGPRSRRPCSSVTARSRLAGGPRDPPRASQGR